MGKNEYFTFYTTLRIKGWKLVGVYREHASTWAGGRQTEPARCVHDAQHHHFDTSCHYIPHGEGLIR